MVAEEKEEANVVLVFSVNVGLALESLKVKDILVKLVENELVVLANKFKREVADDKLVVE